MTREIYHLFTEIQPQCGKGLVRQSWQRVKPMKTDTRRCGTKVISFEDDIEQKSSCFARKNRLKQIYWTIIQMNPRKCQLSKRYLFHLLLDNPPKWHLLITRTMPRRIEKHTVIGYVFRRTYLIVHVSAHRTLSVVSVYPLFIGFHFRRTKWEWIIITWFLFQSFASSF